MGITITIIITLSSITIVELPLLTSAFDRA
jgi:hypothetical protein